MVKPAYASWGKRRMNPMRKKITAKKECNFVTSTNFLKRGPR
jgi:hypothetical protein